MSQFACGVRSKPVFFLFSTALLGWSVAVSSPTGPTSARASEPASHGCGDLLAQIRRKPAHLVYLGCSYLPDRQGKPLRATYHVSGRFAASVEAYLVKSAGLNRLHLSCCQWDSAPGQFKDEEGREFVITMTSDETLVADRTAWRGIPMFEIVVESSTEDV